MLRWGQAQTAECPNCGKFENASHLNLCPSPHRRKLLQRSILTLTDWMKENYAHPEVIEEVSDFLRAQGRTPFTDLGTMSISMHRIAHVANSIGWTHSTKGKIPRLLRDLQSYYLVHCLALLTLDTWMQGFVGQLLKHTHSQ